ncbi:unnamed protein product, partial [Urochloa humidicola]
DLPPRRTEQETLSYCFCPPEAKRHHPFPCSAFATKDQIYHCKPFELQSARACKDGSGYDKAGPSSSRPDRQPRGGGAPL